MTPLSKRLREAADAHKEAAKQMIAGNGHVDEIVCTRLAFIEGLKEIEQLEADAALGKLVRRMLPGSDLECWEPNEWYFNPDNKDWEDRFVGPTPEAALLAALGESE